MTPISYDSSKELDDLIAPKPVQRVGLAQRLRRWFRKLKHYG